MKASTTVIAKMNKFFFKKVQKKVKMVKSVTTVAEQAMQSEENMSINK